MKSRLLVLILIFTLLPIHSLAAAEDEPLNIPKGTTLACYSEDDIKDVAKRLYDHTSPETESTKEIRRAYEQGEYLGSLILYRKLIIDRLRRSQADMEGTLLKYYYGWDTYYKAADVMVGYRTFEEAYANTTTKDVLHMLDFPDIDKPSHVNWLPCDEKEPILTGGTFDLMSITNLANRAAHTGDYIYVRKIFQYLEDFADNLPIQNIEHFGWGDTPLLERSFEKAKVTLAQHYAEGYYADYNFALAPQDIGARKLGFSLGRANEEMYIFYTMSIAVKTLPIEGYEHLFGINYPKTLYEQSFTDELTDEAYDIVDPVRLTKIMMYMLEYSLPVLGETMKTFTSVPSANIGVSAYGALARMSALLKDFDSAIEYADALLPQMNEMFSGTQFKDGGFMESHFNYNEGEAANKRALYMTLAGVAPEFLKYLTIDLKTDVDNWNLVVEGYSGVLLPNVGNYSNYGSSRIWQKVPELEVAQGKQLQDYTSVYYPYSGFVAERDGWLYDGFHMAALTKKQKYSGHKIAQTNAILNLQAYGRQLIINGGMPFYGKSYVKAFPDFLENGYDEINNYMFESSTKKASTVIVNGKSQTSQYFDFDENGVLKKGQNRYGKTEKGFNEQIYNARWLSNDAFDFAEGVYDNGWTLWDYNYPEDSFPELDNLPIEQAITKDATHNREFIYVKNAKLWIVLDKLTNTHNESNEYSCMWHFAAPDDTNKDWRLTGFKNEEVEISEDENLVRTNSNEGPNLYIYNFSNEALSYKKYFGFWEPGSNQAYGWSVAGNKKEKYGNKYTERAEVHVKWKDQQKGDVTRLASVLAPTKNTDNPIISQKNISDEDVTGFEIETKDGVKVYFYSGDKVQTYSKGNVNVRAKEVCFVEKDGNIDILALDSEYADRGNVSLNYMAGNNFAMSVDSHDSIKNINNFGVPETFAWVGDKEEAGKHKPVYTVADTEKEYVPSVFVKDVNSHWARYYVFMLEQKNIIDRCENFLPDVSIARGDFIKWLVKASGMEIVKYNSCFKDINSENVYADYIQTAYDNGIIQGSDGNFHADEPLTREEMVTVINNIVKGKKQSDGDIKLFNDYEIISDWAKEAAKECLRSGIVVGDENFNFNPKENFSRAEAAAVIAKIFFEAY